LGYAYREGARAVATSDDLRFTKGFLIATPISLLLWAGLFLLLSAAVSDGRELMAWSIIRAGNCEVHIVDPSRSYQPQWTGHEVTHCIWGRFHK